MLNIEIVAKEGLKRELTIEIPVDVVDKTYQTIYDEYRRNAKIDGFRPGKAPVGVIRTRFKDEATAELVDQLVKEYYNQAVKENNLDPVGPPVLQAVDVDEGKPFKFTLGIEVLPQIDAIAAENLWVYRPPVEIADTEVEGVLDELRRRHSDVRSVERPSRAEDVLVCDLEIVEGEVGEAERQPITNQEIDLGHPSTDREFREKLTGAGPGQDRNVDITYPADYPNASFAGKKVVYKITVREVKERILPALDDAFAAQVEKDTTLLELKLKIRKQLEAERTAELARTNKRLIIDQMVGQNAFDVPEILVQKYLNDVIEDYKKDKVEMEEDVIRTRYRPMGMASLRWYFLYHRLGELEKIEVSQEDTENWIKRFAEHYGVDVPRAKQYLEHSGKGSEIKDGILEEKILDHLMAKATVKTELPQAKKGSDDADSNGG